MKRSRYRVYCLKPQKNVSIAQGKQLVRKLSIDWFSNGKDQDIAALGCVELSAVPAMIAEY